MAKQKTKDILNKDTLTEADIAILKRRANNGEKISFPRWEYNITPEHGEKGLKWLVAQWKTPRGRERTNNPFGYREEAIIEDCNEITFGGFYVDEHSYNYPLYRVYDKSGNGFEYCVIGGGIYITG